MSLQAKISLQWEDALSKVSTLCKEDIPHYEQPKRPSASTRILKRNSKASLRALTVHIILCDHVVSDPSLPIQLDEVGSRGA